mgnify:CR=1 FL=1
MNISNLSPRNTHKNPKNQSSHIDQSYKHYSNQYELIQPKKELPRQDISKLQNHSKPIDVSTSSKPKRPISPMVKPVHALEKMNSPTIETKPRNLPDLSKETKAEMALVSDSRQERGRPFESSNRKAQEPPRAYSNPPPTKKSFGLVNIGNTCYM